MLNRSLLMMALGLLPTLSCTFLFTSESESEAKIDGGATIDSGAPIDCVGVQRKYLRGEPVMGSTTRFENLDYSQGTLTFWAKALKPVEANVELLNLGGIRVTATATGAVSASVPTVGGNASYTTAPGAVNWVAGRNLFIALRWDSKRPVSGTQGGGYHLMLRVGQARGGSITSPIEVDPASRTEMIVGDAKNVIQVDQLVVYGRPLFVDDGAGPDELATMAAEKTDAAQLVRGGVDVSFATSSPPRAGCNEYRALAWSMPTGSEIPGDVRSGGAGIDWSNAPEPVPQAELIFSSGVAAREFGSTSSFDLELDANASYSLYALAHGEGAASPRLRVFLVSGGVPVGGPDLLDEYGPNSTVDNPTNMFATFQTTSIRFVRVELSSIDGETAEKAIFHTLVIRKNSYANPGFESPTQDDLFDGWELRTSGKTMGYLGDINNTNQLNSGVRSACFVGEGSLSDVGQSPNDLVNGDFYAAGAAFLRGATIDGVAPGITSDASGFFGTGAPHEDGKRVEARGPVQQAYILTGVVGYHLRGPEVDATHDSIYFGGLNSLATDVVDICMDDAYFHPVTKIEGTFGP